MYYTYLWLREDGTPYYVGKGSGRRAYVNCGRTNAYAPVDHDRIILQEFISERDALDAEIFLISFYGRKDLQTGCLRNLTAGGDGISNPSLAHRIKLRQAMLDNDYAVGNIAWNRGKSWDAPMKQKLSETISKAASSVEARKQLSINGRKGAEARWGKTKVTNGD
jgi:hypothetical protein